MPWRGDWGEPTDGDALLEARRGLGVLAALDDRPRAGRDAGDHAGGEGLAGGAGLRKADEFGYPHELWTTRLLAAHARDHGPAAGHPSLAKLAQGTVCKILAAHEVKPHKVRYYLERRDPEFEPKMAEVLCVYREVEMRRAAGGGANAREFAVVSYDEKPGIQAIGTTAPDLPPVPGTIRLSRDHEYKRHGTVTLMAGIDLLTGQVHALVKSVIASRIHRVPSNSMPPIPPRPRSRSSSTITPPTSPRRPRPGSPPRPEGRFSSFHAQARLLAQPRRRLLRQIRPLALRHIRVTSKHELKHRIMAAINDLNRDPVIHRWTYALQPASA